MHRPALSSDVLHCCSLSHGGIQLNIGSQLDSFPCWLLFTVLLVMKLVRLQVLLRNISGRWADGERQCCVGSMSNVHLSYSAILESKARWSEFTPLFLSWIAVQIELAMLSDTEMNLLSWL